MIDGADNAWLMMSSALVLLMTLPALGFFYAGLVQAKNVLSVFAQSVAMAGLASLIWFAVGYSLAFSGTAPWIGSLHDIFLSGLTRGAVHPGTHVAESAFIMFQMTFAIITPALIIGAYVERIRFAAVLMFSALWLVIVYVPVVHWVWGGGWLARHGVLDFAGGIVVHVTAGVSALVVALALGPRRGFPQHVQPPHAPWMVMAGAAMLWVGWFGFNAGSALASGSDAAMAMLATHLAAATATLVWITIEWIKFGKPSLIGAVTGTVAGLATITPASGYVGPAGAVVLGLCGGAVCYGAVLLVKRVFRIDDSLDVLGVHGVGGALGTLLLPLAAVIGAGGLPSALHGGVGPQTAIQLLAVVVVAIWSAAASYGIVKLTNVVVGLRVSRDDELQGLDFASHGESAYHGGSNA
ncbi:MAG: ammonium transporter [Alphaproteobacteria bacterium]|nr:ammonium transporter [Alphaproteobacteria bacterium]